MKSIGLCNAPIGLIKRVSSKYGVTPDRVYAEFVGLNHLHWLKYFYMTDEMLEEQLESLKKGENRAEVVKRVEEERFKLYSDVELKEKPKQLEQRGGAYYSVAAVNLMCSLYNGKNEIQTMNVANNGILDFLPDDASIEVNCVVTPLVPSVGVAIKLLDEMLEANKEYLPNFFK